MSGSIYKKGKPNTNITSLFFKTIERNVHHHGIYKKKQNVKNKGKCTGETKQPRVNHSSDKLSIFPTFSKFEGDTSSQRLLFDNSPLQSITTIHGLVEK